MRIDHLAILAADLDDGVAWAEARLGVPPRGGRRHDRLGTWNRLVRLGPGEYLEVIAPDPEAEKAPGWFGLALPPSPPRVGNWICRVDDLDSVLEAFPEAGPAMELASGQLTWRIGIPEDGTLPEAGGLPSLIEWRTGPHPAETLPDDGLALVALEVRHPRAEALSARLSGWLGDPRVRFVTAPLPALAARIATPRGEVVL